MARRKSKARQKEEFLKALIVLVIAGSFLPTYFLSKSIKLSVIVAGIGFVVLIGILVARRLQEIERLKKSGIADIDTMDGIQFEHYLGHLFKSQGYKVEVTRAAGDYGADLVITKDSRKIVVQAKRYSKNVGIEAVQQIHSSIQYYSASEGWVVCNQDYTDAAYNLAKSNNVRLIDREGLVEMILKKNPGTVPAPKQVIEQIPQEHKVCPRCSSPMVLRKGPKGEFYGCSSFPKCRGVKAV